MIAIRVLVVGTMLLPRTLATDGQRAQLRGSTGAWQEPSYNWVPLGGWHHVADDEGNSIGNGIPGSVGDCKKACERVSDCKSFAFCGDACYLKDKTITKDSPYHYNEFCTTYYNNERNSAAPDASGEQCFHIFSDLAMNSLVQTYPGNPDSMATGYADCYLCTNGTMTCSADVFGGRTRLIASHIHIADNGDGATGSGAPVINFCGDNGDGFINDGTDYRSPCSAYDEDGSAYMPTMFGGFVEGTNMGYTLASRIMDIGMNPHKYYFNFHSIASWAYWKNHGNGSPVGMCRGVLALSATDGQLSQLRGSARTSHEPVSAQESGEWAPEDSSERCFHIFSDIAMNSLVQDYPGNPDSMATGYTDCYLCTNGTMTCSATVFGGRTRLIASHIHIADNGDGATGSGAPVINFCGDNGDGFINDGTDYRSPCSAYDDGHSAYMPTMFGAFVEGTNMGYTLASRIMDIGMNPHKYYFNFHSIASWAYWKNHGDGSPVGMCRGVLALA